MSSPQDRSQCQGCRAVVADGALLCEECGARVGESPALSELRGVVYLLSELKGWEAQGLIAAAEAATLRSKYESRGEALRAQVAAEAQQARASAAQLTTDEDATAHGSKSRTAAGTREADRAREIPAGAVTTPPRASLIQALLSRFGANRAQAGTGAVSKSARRRSLFETLADPEALRLLLYTGAAILVVGVVIWLRDVLYLKLREPLVQAVLLAIGTAAVMLCGWLMTLRTRLRLTGRALTLIGSLLVPVNFWFLSRSGLINGNGREWVVCALCAVLYGLTAALLRERLYVYMASMATIATAWALIFRAWPEAYGLYCLTLTAASLIFLHLSRVFPAAAKMREEANQASDGASVARAGESKAELPRASFELWGGPLVRVALAGAGASAAFYMLLRVGSSPPVEAGAFRWWASEYEAWIAVVLFAAAAYVAWFAARFIDTTRGALLLTTSALALMWAEFLVLDGARVRGAWQLSVMAATALAAAVWARMLRERVMAGAVHRASAAVLTALFVMACALALVLHLAPGELEWVWRPSLLLTLGAVAVSGVLGEKRAGERSVYDAGLSAAAAMVLTATALDALKAASLFPQGWPVAAGVVCAAFVLGWVLKRAGQGKTAAAGVKESALASEGAAGRAVARAVSSEGMVWWAAARAVLDGAVSVCGVLWLVEMILQAEAVAGRAAAVSLLAAAYWIERGAQARRALFVYMASGQAAALLLALLMAAGVERRWMALVFTVALFPVLFAVGRVGRARGFEWLAVSAGRAAWALAALVVVAVVWDAAPLLEAGNERLLAPLMTAGALSAATMGASLFSSGGERVRYFRVGLGMAVAAFVLAVLRAGYEPLIDVEMYTSPIAALLLIVAALSVRREWDEYTADTGLLLWAGSLLLCGPLLARALQFRLLLDVAAPWRDAGVVGVAVGLLLFGVMNRLRAPVIVGLTTLLLELVVLALTSVRWLQVPLWKYMVTVGTLILIIWGMFENRREQLLLMRQRLHERGAAARERFEQWR